MPAKTPSYRLHRATGQALVELSGKRIYLGKHGTPESLQRYAREVAAWQANGRTTVVLAEDLTIAEPCDQFMAHATGYYVKSGEQTSETANFLAVVRLLMKLYGDVAVSQFGVLELRVIREEMIALGWARTSINRAVGRIRRIFRWGVGRAMVKADVVQALECVEPLKRGRCKAKEPIPVHAVPDTVVNATLLHLSPTLRAMVELQRLTGMRGGELTAMRGRDLDMTGETWVYTPEEHKTSHHGCSRSIYLGKRAKAIISPFLKADTSAYLFSPAQAEAERRAALHAKRVTPLHIGNRPGTNKSDCPKRPPGDRYDSASYRRAVARACELAWPSPHGLSKEEKARWRKEHHWHLVIGA